MVAAKEHHSFIVDQEGAVWAFGSNSYGQLGSNDRISRWSPVQVPLPKASFISTGEKHTAVIDPEGSVWIFGSNSHGELGLGIRSTWVLTPNQIPGLKAWAAAAGNSHTLVVGR